MEYFIEVFTTLYNNPKEGDNLHKIPNIEILSKFILLNVDKENDIVKYLIKPLQDKLKKIEERLDELYDKGVTKIKIDLHNNSDFYNEMVEFDKLYIRAYNLMA